MNQTRLALRNGLALLATCALACAAGCSQPARPAATAPAAPAAPPVVNHAGAGLYILDKPHTSVNFRVSHLGLSYFTARFTRIDGKLNFDPAHPAAQSVTATIDPASIQTNYPDPKYDFDGQLRGAQFLDTARFPQMSYRSTKVEMTGPDRARVTGDLTFRGVTKPVVLAVTFNGGSAPNAMDPAGARIGFSARGALKRSDFGMGYGVPAKGSTMGVGDEVEIIIETEFTKK